MTEAPTWTILIPTLGERRQLFERLMRVLMPQVNAAGGQVQVLAYWNNGSPGLPEIRQRLIEATTTDYVSFVDDDDLVSDRFVSQTLAALTERPDYVGFEVEYIADGVHRGIVDHSLKHGGWREEKKPYRLLRDISHINPMRTDVAKLGDFRTVRTGQAEDRPWVTQIRETGRLRTEVYIPRVMYRYLWDRKVSRWRNPARIRPTRRDRPVIDSPHFSYFSEEIHMAPKSAPAGARLGLIIPTRGRPENIEKVITAWDETDAWADADMILAIDADDPEHRAYLDLQLSVQGAKRILLHQSARWVPMVTKLNAAAAHPLLADYWALGFAGDDHLPRTKGWARRYLDALGALGAGMVYGDDGYQGAKLSTEWAVTADTVKATGRMVPAPVDHLYCDNAMMDLFGQAGALRHLADVQIEHMHPVAGKAATDAQYQKVNSREQYSGDRRAYDRWKRTELPSQIQVIRSLRGEPTGATVKSVTKGWGMKNVVRRSGPSQYHTRGLAPKEFRYVRGATPDEIGITLADFARQVPADQAIVELGVYQARTALMMAWGARQGNGAHVYGIDPWDLPGNVYDPPFTEAGSRNWAFSNVDNLGYSGQVALIQGFSGDEAAVWPYVGDTNHGGRIGLLYVDGDHTKEGARRDIEVWAPHLADGAVIAVDDYGHPDWPGVGQAVDELVAEGFLKPIELYHNRLAVTALASPATTGEGGKDGSGAPVPQSSAVTAITSEGVERREMVDGPHFENDLDSLSLGELRALARERKIPGASRLQRSALLEALGGKA